MSKQKQTNKAFLPGASGEVQRWIEGGQECGIICFNQIIKSFLCLFLTRLCPFIYRSDPISKVGL